MVRVANQAPRLLNYLQERAVERRGWVDMAVLDLVNVTAINTHDITKMLRLWQKRGLVKFIVHRRGGVDILSGIRLTDLGQSYQFPEARTTMESPPTVVESYANGHADPPEERARKSHVRITPEQRTAMQDARDEGASIEEVAKRFDVSSRSVVAHTAPRRVASREAAAAAREAAPPVQHADLLLGLPQIDLLLGRQERLLNAAGDIEADAPDIAERLIARAQEFTPLEREVLTLASRLNPTTQGGRHD